MCVRKIVGTSGWSSKHRKGVDYLHFYSQEFDCTEINTSFYHLPKEQTVLNRAAKVPPDFYRLCSPYAAGPGTQMRQMATGKTPGMDLF
jgi:hypothetical protein